MDINSNEYYYQKYLKYKNKYLELKALQGGKSKESREINRCERKAVCNFVKSSLPEAINNTDKKRGDQYKKIDNYTKAACDRMEQLEKVNISSETLSEEYKSKLNQINIYKNDLEKELKTKMKEPDCELKKFRK
jgi:hypothetical protein